MGKSSEPDTHTTTQISEPPEYMRPYIEGALADAQSLYQTRPLTPYTAMHPAAQTGYVEGMQTAMDPQLIDPAVAYAQHSLSGSYLHPTALQHAAEGAIDDVMSGTRSAFEMGGRSGSGLASEAIGRGVTSALAPVYQRERGMQQQMALAAPQIEHARMQPAQNLVNLGMGARGEEERYYQEPWQRLARYTGIALGNAPGQLAGGTVTGTQPIYQPSPFSQIAGLGMMGAGLFL